MFEKIELLKQGFWSEKGPYNDVVISSRIRFARNVQSVPFPGNMGEGEKDIVFNVALKYCENADSSDSIKFVDMHNLTGVEKRLLREMNFITDEMEKRSNCAVIIDEKKQYSILVNEEDHFRIQVIRPGLQLRESYEAADRIDDSLNRIVPYAFTTELGFLTACPSNIGTAMKASVLMHLPVMTFLKRIPELAETLRKDSIELRGTNGAGNRTMGCIYQLSNRISLGVSEVDILETLDGLVNKIIDLEDTARDDFVGQHRSEIEDKIFRSLGLLKYSRRIGYAEAMEHLSNLRLGLVLGLIRNMDLPFIHTMMVNIQMAHLQKIFNLNFENNIESEEYRGEYLRINFNSLESA